MTIEHKRMTNKMTKGDLETDIKRNQEIHINYINWISETDHLSFGNERVPIKDIAKRHLPNMKE